MLDYTGSEEGYTGFKELVKESLEVFPAGEKVQAADRPTPEKKQEGFITAGQVQYVALAGNYRKKGLDYTGALRALKVIMGYDYLWGQIRVKGGAYGCMSGFAKNGDSYFVSYRDPNLEKTLEVYRGACEYLKNFRADERTMDQYVIGAVSELDVPLTPQTRGLRSLSAYMTNQTEEDFQKERDQLLQVREEDIRRLADYVEAILEDDCICVVGTRSKITENEKLFETMQNLL